MPDGFIPFGASHPDLVDQCSATSSGDMGSLTVSGSGITYTADGVQLGAAADSGDARAYWSSSFLSGIDFSQGLTVAFKMERAAFDAVQTNGEHRLMIIFDAASGADHTIRRQRISSGHNYRMTAGNQTNFRTISTGYRDHVEVHISHNPAGGGSFGTLEIYLDYFLEATVELTSALGTENIYLMGKGNSGNPNLLFRFMDVMLFNSAMTFNNVNEKTVVVGGDSQGVYTQYNSGTESNDDPALVGEIVDDYGDGTTTAREDYKNRSLFAALHYELIKAGIYPKGGRIHGFARSGTRMLASSGKPVSERVDAIVASTGAAGPPYPAPGLGPTDSIDIAFMFCGDNDVTAGNDPDLALADYKTELARLVGAGAEAVVVSNVGKRFDPVDPPADADVQAMNVRINSLHKFVPQYRVLDSYARFDASHKRDDGIHYAVEACPGLAEGFVEQLVDVYAPANDAQSGPMRNLAGVSLSGKKLAGQKLAAI